MLALVETKRSDGTPLEKSLKGYLKVTPGSGPASFRPKTFEIFPLYDL